MTTRCIFATVVVSGLIAATAASAQQKPAGVPCGGSPPQLVTIAPVTKFSPIDFSNKGADCAMWQNFFYLNWPALRGQRGVPNTNAKFGAPGPTVWETYRTLEQVFLPNAQKPLPWDQNFLHAALPRNIATEVAGGQVRALIRTSKISRTVINVIAQEHAGEKAFLDSIRQADGHILYDQQKRPVYYEIAMNRVQFDYIRNNGLYNADTQLTYVQTTNIALPVGSIELKAAWKILTGAEITSGRFHTARAYILGPILQPVVVGLVGLHVFTGGGPNGVGMWGTFAQIDNAPLDKAIGAGPYTFYNTACTNCPVNDKTTDPTQVVQIFADDLFADQINAPAQAMIKQYDSKTPWQFYKLINVQWSPRSINLTTPVPIMLPLPQGMPSTETLMNPVLETFMQTTDTSCIKCHADYASLAKNGKVGAGFSFMFSNAQSPPPSNR